VRITRIAAYRLELPFVDGEYGVSGGRTSTAFDSTLVVLETDAGVEGYGEYAALGATYDPAFAGGARAGLEELAPALLGMDPLQADAVGRRLDATLRGHPYAKSALDMACWDAAGKSVGRPLSELLGGRYGDAVTLYCAVPPAAPESMARAARAKVAGGYRRVQVKVGEDPLLDLERVAAVRAAVGDDVVLIADANGGWTVRDARRFLLGLRDEGVVLEQPCATLDEIAAVRPQCRHPLVLDESIDSVDALLRASSARLADGITIKLARVGGITKARLIRDLAVAFRIPVTVEDTGGGAVDTAAMTQVSLSTPEELRTHTYDFAEFVTVSNADGLPPIAGGSRRVPEGPGLGVTLRRDVLGPPFLDVRA
jgi:L-alanine-DL-glutamate epimerase-like enolase superfamily enzyme